MKNPPEKKPNINLIWPYITASYSNLLPPNQTCPVKKEKEKKNRKKKISLTNSAHVRLSLLICTEMSLAQTHWCFTVDTGH